MSRPIWTRSVGVFLGMFIARTLLAGATGALTPVPFSDVKVEDSFWSPRLEVNRTVSIPHNLATCEQTGRIHNFEYVAGVSKEPFRGHIFHDSDVYKVLEGVAYSLANHPDKELEARLDRIIGLVAKCQQPDGYVNTWFTAKEPQKRWQGLQHAHELYCAGHMFEAAVAHFRATGKRTFLDVACRFADYIGSVFGEDKRRGIAGHPEIELALVKLWRATGEDRYLELARFFVREHGRTDGRKLFGRYCQDHAPVAEQTEPVGHAVRFLYFYSGVADLAGLDGNPAYIQTMEQLWQYIVQKKMYVTGGVGVQGHGEGFARAYYLPNYEAYCETCASIGMAFWNHRLALLHGQGRFADLVERVLYNGALSGVSLDGARFFYVNPLASRGNHHRQAWYGCACCPTNVVRFVASVGNYVYAGTPDGEGASILQYVGGSGTVPLKDGKVTFVQRSGYPWDGTVHIIVEPAGVSAFTVYLRIPGWCQGAKVLLNGRQLENVAVKDGFVSIRREWAAGESIGLDLPMPVRQVAADPKVEADVGRLAIVRGPMVYCLEGADHTCPVSQIAIPKGAKFEVKHEPALLGGVTVLHTKGVRRGYAEDDEGGLKLVTEPVEVKAIPYYAWDNREPGEMVVWVPTDLPEADASARPSLAVLARATASHCHSADSVEALRDGVLPKNSIDHSVPRFTWWDHKGTAEWVAYEWEKPKLLASVGVYWFDDTGRGQCRVPKSWRLLWRYGDQWQPVKATSDYGTAKDKLNVVKFEPVKTRQLRLEVQLQPDVSGGILEWRAEK